MNAVNPFKISVISKRLIITIILLSNHVEANEALVFGKCCKKRTDIIYIVGTYKKCAGLCQERPACMAYSYHRLSWLCRLHTDECSLDTCVGFLHSKKESWIMTNFDACACTEGHVCEATEGTTRFTCKIKECSPPNELSNGKIYGNDFRVGRHIRCDCNAGYVPEGQLIRQCQENGSWSGVEPSCNTVCPVVGSLEWGQSCFFIVTNMNLLKSFADASAYCAAHNGHVIHVTSQEEHDFITSKLAIPDNPAATRYWIGIERNTEDGIWYLTGTNKPIEFTVWASGEPSNGPTCAVYKYDLSTSSWLWFTESCTDYSRFPLCEYD